MIESICPGIKTYFKDNSNKHFFMFNSVSLERLCPTDKAFFLAADCSSHISKPEGQHPRVKVLPDTRDQNAEEIIEEEKTYCTCKKSYSN